ncbi:MAG TPA: 50S ribosomal protein L32 [Acidobacteriota bacterium]|nr:50S ribosomal protein L32 [Acidobacteriota bacterium]
MANPKRKISKGRRDRRRSHDSLKTPGMSICPNCYETKMPHRACAACGYYKGREVIKIEEE